MKICVLSILLAVSLLVSADSIPENIPSSTNVLARLDLKSAVKNPTIKRIKDTSRKYKEFLSKLKKGVSFDFEKADSIWFAGRNMEEGFLILKGNFDTDDISSTLVLNPDVEMMNVKACKFAAKFQDEKNKDIKNIGLIVDDNTIVFGKELYVEGYLKVLQGKGARFSSKKRSEAAPYFEGKNDLTVVFLKFLWPIKNPGMQIIVDNLNAGILSFNLEKDLDVKLVFDFKSAQFAQQFKQPLEMLLTAQLSNKQGSRVATVVREELGSNLDVKAEKNNLIVKSKISKNKVDELLSFFLLRKEGMAEGGKAYESY
jgi:hypothetical protein